MDNPLIKQQEEYNKIVELVDLINSNPDPRELKRALAVKMSIDGHLEPGLFHSNGRADMVWE